MLKTFVFTSVAITFALQSTTFATVATLTFDSNVPLPLPYTEDGVTFENVVPNSTGVGNHLYFLGGGSSTYHVRASSSTPFDLKTLDVVGVPLSITWRLETSAGGSKTFNVDQIPYTLDLNGTPGFDGITYFDIIHDYFQDRRALNVDNVVIDFVPEPSSGALILISALILLMRRACRS